jgi:transposase
MDILTDSHRVSRLEVVDTGRRRRWSESEKLRIVEESFSGPRQASATARRHGISTTLLFAWRKAYREGRLGAVCGFVPAVVAPEKAASEPPTEDLAASSPDPERGLSSLRHRLAPSAENLAPDLCGMTVLLCRQGRM